jgi:putative hydrolase of the HAD superfamily
MIIDWQQIDTVLLDMDGTLLDLHYDNYFWVEYLPQKYGEKNGLSIEESKMHIQPILQAQIGKLEWYCTDYWSEQLDLDITSIKSEEAAAKKIAFRSGAQPFLQRLNDMGKQVWLVTNAHRDVLEIKCQRLPLEQYFHQMVSSHDYGYSKEQNQFWHSLQKQFPFEIQRSLFVDDSLDVLKSAQAYGIEHLRAISIPDSQKSKKDTEEFMTLCLTSEGQRA